MRPAVFPEEGDIGKHKDVGYLFDTFIGVFEPVAHINKNIFVYPVICSFAAYLLACGGKIFGRDTKLFGIP